MTTTAPLDVSTHFIGRKNAAGQCCRTHSGQYTWQSLEGREFSCAVVGDGYVKLLEVGKWVTCCVPVEKFEAMFAEVRS